MPRPRQNTDEQILRAAFRAIARLGPARVTLADVASEAGVTPASLVQRFGSKRALLLAAAADAAGGHTYLFAGLRASHRSPLAALLGLADCMRILGDTAEEVAHSLAFLQWDLTDREFHQRARAGSTVVRTQIAALIRDAVAAGELKPVDSARLAHAVQAALNGSILGWVLHREGTLATWLRRDLRAVLEPHRRSRKSHVAGRKSGVARRQPASRA